MQNAKFKDLKGTLNIVTNQSNPYDPRSSPNMEAKIRREGGAEGSWAGPVPVRLAGMVQAGNPRRG